VNLVGFTTLFPATPSNKPIIQANNRRHQHWKATQSQFQSRSGGRRSRFRHAYLCERGAPCRGGWEGRSSSCSAPWTGSASASSPSPPVARPGPVSALLLGIPLEPTIRALTPLCSGASAAAAAAPPPPRFSTLRVGTPRGWVGGWGSLFVFRKVVRWYIFGPITAQRSRPKTAQLNLETAFRFPLTCTVCLNKTVLNSVGQQP